MAKHSFSRGFLLSFICVLSCLSPTFASTDLLPVRQVIFDIYDHRTRTVREVVECYVGEAGPAGLAGVCGVSPDPTVRDAATKARRPRAMFAVDQPGRSPADILRIAAGGSPTKAVGQFRILCLLVDFSDNVAQTYAGAAGPRRFKNLLFSRGVRATGSMAEYYDQNSYNNFVCSGDVQGGAAGWYRAPQTYAYYTDGKSGLGAYPKNMRGLVESLVDLADPNVDYKRYDNDRDGYVDGLIVVHAGAGAESVPQADQPDHIWSHKGEINDRRRDGVAISAYCTGPEISTIGVFAHEFGHVLGLPDLYDTDASSGGVGLWSLMGLGTWLTGSAVAGEVPAHFDAWSKMRLGWLTPTVVRQDMLRTAIEPVETTPRAYALWKDGSPGDEYFLVENRQRLYFDQYLPRSGLLIWHVDESKHVAGNTEEWFPGRPRADHYLVALEQADGRWDLEHKANLGDAGDPYLGNTGNPFFREGSTPDSRSYAGGATSVEVSDITVTQPGTRNIIADLRVTPSPLTPPTSLTLTPNAPLDADNLHAWASGGAVPIGTVAYEYSWWASRDGGRTYTRKIGLGLSTLDNFWTEPWQMWKAKSRTTNGARYSDWTESEPVTIIPTTDRNGNPFTAVWFVHDHPKPDSWTWDQWDEHVQQANGRSWATAFHSAGQAALNAQDGALVLFGPGDYNSNPYAFRAVTLMGTSPNDAAVRSATILRGASLAGGDCFVTGLNLVGIRVDGATGTAVFQKNMGSVSGRPTGNCNLTVIEHQGAVDVALQADATTKVSVTQSTLTELSVMQGGASPLSAAISVRNNAFPAAGLARFDANTATAGAASVVFAGNRLTDHSASFTVSGLATVTGNVVKRGALTFAPPTYNPTGVGPATIANNAVTLAPESAIACRYRAPLTIRGNTIAQAGGRGLLVEICGQLGMTSQITQNVVSGCAGGGAYFSSNVATSVTNNDLHGNALTKPVANTSYSNCGGGISLMDCSGVVTDNDVGSNTAYRGGGIYCFKSTIRGNRIVGNTATEAGGGVWLDDGEAALCEGNTIRDNRAARGGGVLCLQREPLRRNLITGNQATNNGGGIYVVYGTWAAENKVCGNTVSGNTAQAGGGVYCGSYLPGPLYGSGVAWLTGNTIVKNTADQGAGVYAREPSLNTETLYIRDCLITDNGPGAGLELGGNAVTPMVTYSDVFSNAGGNYVGLPNQTGANGNLSVDPLYASLVGDDYHLQSRTGRWVVNPGQWVQDAQHSPCIDGGDPASAFATEPGPNGGRVNIGADGNTKEASKSFQSMILYQSPAPGATGVRRGAVVQIRFRWSMNQDSAQTHFTLRPVGGTPVPGSFTWPTANETMRFKPTTALLANKLYQVTLASGIARQDGSAINWSESFSFATGAAALPGLLVSATALPAAGDGAQVSVTLLAPAAVQVSILNLAGRAVAVLPEAVLSEGVNVLLWNGRSSLGTQTPRGSYLVRVRAMGDDGERNECLTPLRR